MMRRKGGLIEPENTMDFGFDAFSSREPGIHFARKRYNILYRRAVSAGEAPGQGY
jgi:hypothetical protein